MRDLVHLGEVGATPGARLRGVPSPARPLTGILERNGGSLPEPEAFFGSYGQFVEPWRN